MTRFALAFAACIMIAGAAMATPRDQTVVVGGSPASAAPTSTVVPASGRAHYRRWQAIRPYPSYGYYGPRPFFYKPYPYYLPLPFGFGFGFDPAYW